MFKLLTFVALSFFSFAEEKVEEEKKESTKEPFIIAMSSHVKNDSFYEYSKGALSYLSNANDTNMFDGIQVKLLTYENNNKPKRDGDNTKRFVQFDKAKLLFGYVSAEGIDESIGIIKEKEWEIAMLFPFLSFSREFHKKPNNIFHFRPTIETELEKIGSYLNKQEGTIAIIYRESDKQHKDYFVSSIKDKDRVITYCSYKTDPLQLNSSLLKVKKAKPNFIVMLGDEKSSTNFVKRAIRTSLKSVQFIAPSYVAGAYMMKEMDNTDLQLIVSRTMEAPDSDSEDAKEFKRLLNKHFPRVPKTYAAFEGYLAAKQVAHIVQESMKANKDIKEDILEYIKEKKLWKRDNKVVVEKAVLKKEEE